MPGSVAVFALGYRPIRTLREMAEGYLLESQIDSPCSLGFRGLGLKGLGFRVLNPRVCKR